MVSIFLKDVCTYADVLQCDKNALFLVYLFPVYSFQFFLAYRDVFIVPKSLNHEFKLNLLIKDIFDNKHFPNV